MDDVRLTVIQFLLMLHIHKDIAMVTSIDSVFLQIIDTDVAAHKPGLDSLMKQAEEISRSNTDSRMKTYAEQVGSRYSAVAATVKVSENKGHNVT